MQYITEIKAEISEVSSLNELAEVYGEIAAVRMKKIREFVLKNRSFLASIESIFKDTLASYALKLSQRVQEGKLKAGGKMTFLAHNGKTVGVFLSANTGFYGEVINETFKLFIDQVRKENMEVTIIGRHGRQLFLSSEPKRPFTYFELPDYGMDRTKMADAIKHLVSYEVIKVYYGKYMSVITQKPEVAEVSAGTPIVTKVTGPVKEYIFEPSIEKILTFFETQIFASFFDQTLRESQLAKFASRILAMNKAQNNIEGRLKYLSNVKLQIAHANQNKKQLNTFPALLGIN